MGAAEGAFTAKLEGRDTGAYRIDANGNLSLIVKGSALGANLALGNYGIAINGKGEVALLVQFTGDKVGSLILLAPTAP